MSTLVEIDPQKTASQETVIQSIEIIQHDVSTILDRLMSDTSRIPPEIKFLSQLVHEIADSAHVQQNQILINMREFHDGVNVAIWRHVCSYLIYTLQGVKNRFQQRRGLLVSKILQAIIISQGIVSKKEPYLNPLVPFIIQYHVNFEEFCNKLNKKL